MSLLIPHPRSGGDAELFHAVCLEQEKPGGTCLYPGFRAHTAPGITYSHFSTDQAQQRLNSVTNR